MLNRRKQAVKELIKRKDVKFIAKHEFNFDLSPGQVEIVRVIAFREYKRITISAHTRYGKTQCVAIAIAIIILLGLPLKIAFIGPKDEQAGIIRQYLTELIFHSKTLLNMAELNASGDDRIKKESSRKRMTFSSGAEYRVYSAEGDANRLMGFGADITIRDESCLIAATADAKILRMLGDNPEEGMSVELYNPWDRDNSTFKHTLDPKWKKIQIGFEQGIREGRTTAEFIAEQRKELTPLEFTVLWKSEFPDESEDSLFNLKKIEMAENRKFDFLKQMTGYEEIIRKFNKHTEAEVDEAKREIKKYKKIISCDPADKGLDETVMYWGVQYENKYQLVGAYSEPKSEQMKLSGTIVLKAMEFIGRISPGRIFIDRIGIGAGALSRVKEVLSQKGYNNIFVTGAHFGEAAIKKDHFINKKAENYFRLVSLINEGLISLEKFPKLKSQMMLMKWELTSSAKRKIVDPENDSPDWCDALVYFVWRDNSALAFGFV